MDYQEILTRIKTGPPFSFSRWGDGEWNAVLEKKGPHQTNADKCKYFDSLREALREVLKSNPQYYLGMQGMANRIMGPEIDSFLKSNNLEFDWINSDVFHHASIYGRFTPFMGELKNHSTILIGPSYLEKLDLNPIRFIIPEVNAWENYETLRNNLSKLDVKGYIFLFCSGMMANVLINDLYPTLGKENYLLDMGSVFEPYVGESTRTYHNDIINRNTKQHQA